MKKLLFVTMLFGVLITVPVATMARVDISIGISLPPPIVFEAPPDVVVIPDADAVYVAPDVEVDLFFWNGWWWRPWEGRWYRSRYYHQGWAYYDRVPSFYFDVDPGWRGYYRDRHWYGHRWNHERISHRRLQQNWKSWHNNRHWERRGTWGVQSYRPRPQKEILELRHQREQQYNHRAEVREHQRHQHQPQAQHPQRGPQVKHTRHEPQVQQLRHQSRVHQPQRHEQMPQVHGPQQRHERMPQVNQPQRQEQRPQDQQARQQPQERVQQPQRRFQAQQPQDVRVETGSYGH